MKKNNHSESTPTLDKLDFIGNIEDHPLLQWISQHGQTLLYTIIGLFSLLFIIYYLSSSHSSKADQDYTAAYQDFLAFQRGKGDIAAQKLSLQKLEDVLKRQPTLHAKYDGLIAQTLLTRSDVGDAMPFAMATLERVSKDDLPFYNDFASTTLLIAQGKTADALERSKNLKQKLLDNANAAIQDPAKKSFGDTLFAFNLLRIAMLQQQAGLAQDELKTWQEWKGYTAFTRMPGTSQAIDSKAFFAVANVFEEGQVTLASYIESREKQLAKKAPSNL